MPKALVIVESPAKAKTINKYLGKEYVVKASLGHIKDLPKRDLAVDVDHGFEPRYEVIEGKKKLIAELKQPPPRKVDKSTWRPIRTAKARPSAITSRKNCKTRRTARDLPRDVQRDHQEGRPEGLRESRAGEHHLVDAQQARRVLDRLVGYKISPLLWDKVRRGLSAGRVQTVALRVIVEREREIRAFLKKEYWTIDVDLAAKKPPLLTARLIRATTRRRRSAPGSPPTALVAQLEGADYTSSSRWARARRSATRWRRSSPPPCSRNPRASCASA
jgi:DNA topoisomerase-1